MHSQRFKSQPLSQNLNHQKIIKMEISDLSGKDVHLSCGSVQERMA
jgi:hypothetical protein